MFSTYLVTAFRNLLKGKLYSAINILGLSMGLAVVIMILLYVRHELTADRHHEHYDELYRVGIEIGIGGPPVKAAVSSYPVGPALQEHFPGVTDFVRFGSLDMMLSDALVEYNDNALYERGILLVDSNFFDLFTHPVVYGDPEAALRHNDVAVLTRSSAERIFGPGNPVGKQFILAQEFNIEVGAVIEDIPQNSHLKFRILLYWNSLNQLTARSMSSNSFFDNNVYTYLRSDSDLNTPEMQQKLDAFIEERVLAGEPIENMELVYRLNLNPLSDLYFLKGELYEPANPESIPAKGNRMFVFVFITVAVFLSVIASINYMNMAVARSGRRSKEVGVRKVLGADRGSLIWQFLSESMLTVVIALLIALLWVELLLPVVNHLLMKDLAFTALLFDWRMMGAVLLLTLITGLFSGSYPAFYLSHFRPSDVLKSQAALSDRNLLIRKVLVGLQFTIS
ncbi:MAG: ABC transporter permease, partial [Bacteroidetes bacterium]